MKRIELIITTNEQDQIKSKRQQKTQLHSENIFPSCAQIKVNRGSQANEEDDEDDRRKRQIRQWIEEHRLPRRGSRRQPLRDGHSNAEVKRYQDTKYRCFNGKAPIVSPPEIRLIIKHRRWQSGNVERFAADEFLVCHAVASTGL